MVTPVAVENRLAVLSKEVDQAQEDLEMWENNYAETKARHEIALARSRMEFANATSPSGKNYTVQEKDALVLLANEKTHYELARFEAGVKASRANVVRIRTQVDIARSIGTSVRASIDM